MKKRLILFALLAARAIFANDSADLDQAAHALHAKAQTILIETRDAQKAATLLDEAETLYQKRIAGEKRRIYAANTQTESLFYLLESANAQQDAVVIDGIWADLFYLRGYARLSLGDADAGKREYDRALAISPAHVMARNGRGNYYLLQKDWDKAQADFQHAIDHNYFDGEAKQATTAIAKRGLGYILIERGAWDEAEALYQQLLAENPNDEKAKTELQYIREQRDGQREPPSFLIHASESPAGQHTSAWMASIRPDIAQAKSAEEYANLATQAMRDHAADMQTALNQDCVALYGQTHAAACACATGKADYRAYFGLKLRAAQGIAEYFNHDFEMLKRQFRAIESECRLPPMPQG